MWKDDGLDLQLTPYRCVVTGKDTGVIEMISDSVTIADIQKRAGIVRGAFIEDTLFNFLREYNTTSLSFSHPSSFIPLDSCFGLDSDPFCALSRWNHAEPLLDGAVENFIHSVAGYCVATFVLGIGDRHNDNIMLSTTGHLFRLDQQPSLLLNLL